MKRVLIIGSNGQLGSNIKVKLSNKFSIINLKKKLDITINKDLEEIKKKNLII